MLTISESREIGTFDPEARYQCQVNLSGSSPQTVSPFGGLPGQQAGGFGKQFSNPLRWGFGIGSGPQANNFLGNLQSGQYGNNPLAQFIQQGRQFSFPGMFQNAQNVGNQLASMAPGAFNAFGNQITNFLQQQLPGIQQNAANMTNQAFSPIQDNAMFQQALMRALSPGVGQAASQGLLGGGGQQAMQDQAAQNLAFQFAQQRFGQQQQALQNQAQLGQAGIAPAQAYLQALPQYGQLLQAPTQMPFQALQQYLGFLGGTQNPTLALLQATAPQVAQSSSGIGIL